MKILILNDFFNDTSQISSKFLKKFLLIFRRAILKNLIKKIKAKYPEISDIELINYHDNDIFINEVSKVSSLSIYRNKLSKFQYNKIVDYVKNNTKSINIKFLNNLNRLKFFNINGIEFSELLEIHLIRFFNLYSGHLELTKQIVDDPNVDKVIFYNIHPSFIKFFQRYNKDQKTFDYYNINLIHLIDKLKRVWEFSYFLLQKIINSILGRFPKFNSIKDKKSILLVANSKNQLNSIRELFKELKKNKQLNPLIYSQKFYLKLANVKRYLHFLRVTTKNWKLFQDQIFQNMGNYSNLMRFFYEKELIFLFSIIFNEYQNLADIFELIKPSLVTVSNELRVESKLVEKYCNLQNVPTIYIPHAGIPITGEVVSKKDFTYLALWGEYDTKYYLNLGMEANKMVITGNPRFEYFYKGGVEGLEKIEDMFSNKNFNLDKKKPTILLATSPYDVPSKINLIKTVIGSLKDLNLIDNLIIKLHPVEDGIIQKEVTEKLNSQPIIVRDYNILELIKSCSILISSVSSIILEAMIIGTPVILADFINLDFLYIQPYAFTNEKFVKFASNQESLTKIIKELVEDKKMFEEYSKSLQKNSKLFSFYDQEHNPIEMIKNLILKAIN